MLEISVAIFYSALCIFIIRRHTFFTTTELKNHWFVLAFLTKCIFGIANYLIWLLVIGHGDSLNYFADSILIYNTLPDQPAHYLQLTFGYRNAPYPEHLRYVSDFLFYSWNTAEYTMVRINAILNILTFGSAFGNIIILCFVNFIVLTILFKKITAFYHNNTFLLFALLYCFPSIAFWNSALLKEGLACSICCMFIIQLLHWENNSLTGSKPLITFFLLFFMLLLIRDFLLLIILPNLVLWYSAKKMKNNPGIIFLAGSLLILVTSICIDALLKQLNIPLALQNIQAYLSIGVYDPYYTFHELTPTYLGIFKSLPAAAWSALFKPNVLHSTDVFRLYQSVELLFTWAVSILCFIRLKSISFCSPLFWFLLFLAVELLFLYGLLVADADTLSRYRALPVFLLLLCLLTHTKSFTKVKTA